MKHEQVYTSTTILERLQQEAEIDGDQIPSRPLYWCTFQLPNKEIHTNMNFKPDFATVLPHELQIDFAKGVLKALNTEVGHGGAWIVGYTHPPSKGECVKVEGDNVWDRLFCIWLDQDGDPQFTVENIRWTFHEMLEAGAEFWMSQGQMCYSKWQELTHGVLDLKQGETFKRALGEKRPST
jgi:hypothetical protein